MDNTIKNSTLEAIKHDPHNANQGTEYGNHLLRKSIQELGIGRGIVVANDGTIIGGNQTVSMLSELGMEKIVIVPTDGNTLVVTQRLDIEPGSKAFHELALADNKVGQTNLNFDMDIVARLGAELEINLDDWGFKFDLNPEPEPDTPSIPSDLKTLSFKLTSAQLEQVELALETATIEKELDPDDGQVEPLLAIVTEYLSRRK